MKNKTLTYVLIVIVAAIWYQVFFRVKNNIMGENEIVQPVTTNQVSLTSIVRDTFILKANYRDPFGEVKRKPVLQHEDQTPPRRNNQRNVRAQQEPWPTMQYFGIVRKTDSKTPLAILKVDGLQLMVRNGEELFNGIYVNHVWRDSVQVRRKKERLVVYRN